MRIFYHPLLVYFEPSIPCHQLSSEQLERFTKITKMDLIGHSTTDGENGINNNQQHEYNGRIRTSSACIPGTPEEKL